MAQSLGYASTDETRRTQTLGQRVQSPPGIIMHSAAMGAMIVTLAAVSVPGGFLLITLAAILAWLAAGGTWLVRLLVFGYMSLRAPLPLSSAHLRWLVFPVLFALAILLVQSSIPANAAFWISRPAMDRWAAQVLKATPATQASFSPAATVSPMRGWVGLYPIGSAQRMTTGFRFSISGAGFIDEEGYAYSTSPLPLSSGSDRYTHIAGCWYRWHWHF